MRWGGIQTKIAHHLLFFQTFSEHTAVEGALHVLPRTFSGYQVCSDHMILFLGGMDSSALARAWTPGGPHGSLCATYQLERLCRRPRILRVLSGLLGRLYLLNSALSKEKCNTYLLLFEMFQLDLGGQGQDWAHSNDRDGSCGSEYNSKLTRAKK